MTGLPWYFASYTHQPDLIPVDGDVVVWFTDHPGTENDRFRVADVDHVDYFFQTPGSNEWKQVNPDWYGEELQVASCGGEFRVKARAHEGYKLASLEEEPMWGHYFLCDEPTEEPTTIAPEKGTDKDAPIVAEADAPKGGLPNTGATVGGLAAAAALLSALGLGGVAISRRKA